MRTSIVLFLNKVDLFRQKLKKSPLGEYFPDYSGGDDVNRAAKYLLWRFNQVNRAHLNLYPQYVTHHSQIYHALLTNFQSHTSHRHLKYSPRIRRSERDDPPERTKGLWYSMMIV